MSSPHGSVGRDLATGDSLSPTAKPPTLSALAERVLATSVAKGFSAPTWGDDFATPMRGAPSNYLAKLMLVVTEIDEAVHTEHELAAECADIAIRILGILQACHATEATGGPPCYGRIEGRSRPAPSGPWASRAETFWRVLQYVVRAAECWRTDDRRDACMSLELALLETFRITDRCGIDLMAAIVEKDAKNRERPMLHGKKRTVG